MIPANAIDPLLRPEPASTTRVRRISVVVPVSERPGSLDALYGEYAPAVRSLGVPFEFVFVISPWGRPMAEALLTLRASGEPIRVLELGQHAGESAMLLAASDAVRGDVIVTLPPYPRVEPSALPVLVRALEGGLDMATARRDRNTALLNRLQNRAFHLILRSSSGTRFEDVASGVRAMRTEVLREVALHGDFFRFLPLLAAAEGFRVEEIEVARHPEDRRPRVYSPGIYVRRLLDLLGFFFLIRFTQKPLRFLGLVGSAFGGVGTAILLVLFFQRLGGRPVSDRPLLVLGVLLFVVGVQAVAIGLVGEIIVHYGATRRRLYRVREAAEEPPARSSSAP